MNDNYVWNNKRARWEIKPDFDKANDNANKKRIRAMLRAQEARDAAEAEYNRTHVCCGFVLPLNGICDVCGKKHK